MFLSMIPERLEDAYSYLQESLSLEYDSHMLRKIHQGLAYVLEQLGRFSDAIPHHEYCVKLSSSDQEKGLALSAFGVCYHKMGNYIVALSMLTDAHKLFPNSAIVCSNFGIALKSSGKVAEAIDMLSNAMQISNKENEKVITLVNLASCWERLGNFSKSLTICQNLLVQNNNQNITADVQYIMANNYSGMGDADKAILFAEKALKHQVDDGLKVNILNCLGNNHSQLGNFQKAMSYFEQALSISKQMSNQALQGMVISNIGDVYFMLHRRRAAKVKYQEALKLAQAVGDLDGEAQSYNCLGICYYHSRKFDRALTMYDKALEIYQRIRNEPRVAQVHGNRGNVLKEQNRFLEALAEHQQNKQLSEKCHDKSGVCAADINIGTVLLELQQLDNSMSSFRSALTQCRQLLKDKMRELKILNNIIAILLLKHQYTEAHVQLTEAEEIVEDIWKTMQPKDELRISFFDGIINLYNAKQQLYTIQHKYEESLLAAEQCRTRALLKELQLPFHGDIRQLRECVRDHNASAVYYSVVTHPVVANNGTLEKERFVYIWMIPQDPDAAVHFARKKLSIIEELHQLIEKVIPTSSGRNIFLVPKQHIIDRKDVLRQLYNILIEPMKDFLPKDNLSRIIFVPQGMLFLVPFAALVGSSNCYLSEKYLISLIPSLHSLEITMQSSLKVLNMIDTEQYIVVGNPTMPLEDLNSLPQSQNEAEQIAALLKTSCKTGNEATKFYVLENIKHSKFIHLATHGILDEVQPLCETYLLGGIALAKSKLVETSTSDDDGFLWAHDIQALDLSGTEMVVLSACNTAQGEITTDGIIGLFRAFIIARVPTIVASLWAIEDDATKQLMVEFYTKLTNGKSKLLAMHEAMQVIRSNPRTSDPLYWAGFSIIGE